MFWKCLGFSDLEMNCATFIREIFYFFAFLKFRPSDFKVFQSFSIFFYSYLHLLQSKISFVNIIFYRCDIAALIISYNQTVWNFFLFLHCWCNIIVKPRFWVEIHRNHFYQGYKINCLYKSIYKISLRIIYTSIGQVVWGDFFKFSWNFPVECFFV